MMIRRTLSRIVIMVLALVLIVYGPNATPVQAAPFMFVSQTSGTPGSVITVNGSGFADNETDIIVTYDGISVASGITADSAGSWSATFVIPASVSGSSHIIDASGMTTAAPAVPDITFTVVPGISTSRTSGSPGSSITVSGSGFVTYEAGITVTFDGVSVVWGITANSQGGWSATFVLPAAASGSHTIDASGSTTLPASVSDITFTVGPGISTSRASGTPGTSITITGSGFSTNESGITVTFDGIPLSSGISANSEGGWSTTFTIPAATSGSHSVDAYGSTTTAAAVSNLTITIGSGISVNRTSGSPGSSITVTGSGFSANEAGIRVAYDGTPVDSGISANSQGGWSITFTVPASASGSHTIAAYGSTTSAVNIPVIAFTVTPGISTSRTSGSPGSSITITGSGFAIAETGITVTFDGNLITSGISANSQGGWLATFVIPASTSGPHTIDAYGAATTAAAVPVITFTVSPGVATSRTSGSPGSSITITGTGFSANEAGITVTFDGILITSGISANSQGGWNTTFVIPASASGPHAIDAYGSITAVAIVPDVIFTISPGISIKQIGGIPGSSMTVIGSGFAASETGIRVTYDGAPVISGLTADSAGSWSTTFAVPASTIGSHSIKAHGSVTQIASVGEASFNVTPGISLSPASGYVGATVQIAGVGFTANSPITFTYDDKEIPAEGLTTDASGSFSKSIIIPKSLGGAHTIKAVDREKNESRASFAMDSNPPPVPSPISPEDGGRVGIAGDTTPALRWSSVTDPSGVTYTLQMDISPDFSQIILEKTDLPVNHYTLTTVEALPYGDYYWRVKAVDGASNQSAWSQPRLLKSGLMPLWALFVTLGLAAVAVGWLIYFLLRRPAKKREAIAVPQAEEVPRVVTVTGQWRSIEPEEATKERALPWRLALPQPVKGTKILSTEEQARLKVIVDFAQSLPLVEAGYTADWLVDLVETVMGIEVSVPVYEQLLRGELQVRYEPTWMHHPTYQDLTTLLEGQPILQDLNAFVDAVNRCASEATSLLQEIYRDTLVEIPSGLLEKGGWEFISAVYSDATAWFLGRSLRDPSERDYSIKPQSGAGGEAGTLWLSGEEHTSFAGPLIQAIDEQEALRFRALHLRLRRTYRNSSRAKEVVGMMTQLEVQRSRLLGVFSQFDQLKQ